MKPDASLNLEALERQLEEQAALFDARPGWTAAGRRRLMQRLPQAQPQPSRADERRAGAWERGEQSWLRRALSGASPRFNAALLALVIVMAFISGNVIGRAAPTWLPGDWMYPLKTGLEQIRLATSPGLEQQAEVYVDLAQRRMLEAQALAIEGRFEKIPMVLYQFNRHVDRAVLRIDVLARTHPEQAQRLAMTLQAAVDGQGPLVEALAQLTPEATGSRFVRALTIAQNSLWAIRDLLPPTFQG